ncbi:MAG TPA: rhomboid family intramembrane serine protease [Bacteroidota bacterium]|nr:rhomboid family intramembrane serine protease [Bacteroidota bacterium]
MIPLRDTVPSNTIPVVNYLLIGLNGAVFLFELSLGRHLDAFILHYGLVPARFLDLLHSEGLHFSAFVPVFTSMFLHGGWLHLLGNMLFLYIFGDNVEDRFGHFRYLVFYLIAGVAAAATQVHFNPDSEMPMVGASGAIAGVLGAYVFLFPTARVVTLIPIFFFFQIVELPAYLFLGIWFFLQIVSGLLSLGIGGDAGGVAWWAHVGGFAAGAALFPFLRKRRFA